MGMAVMDKEKRMAEIKSNFSEKSREYDARVTKIIPRYEEMLGVLVSCTAQQKGRKVRAIDIGCGTGAVSRKLLESHPDVELTCLDMTEGMLDIAKQRLSGHGQVRYVLADLYDFEFDGPYDLAISSLALHHIITDRDKKAIYRKIFDALGPGGSFYNADIVLGSDDELQELYMRQWKEFMYQSFPREEIDHEQVPRYHQEDSPAKLVDHLRWLDEVGFCSVDVVWKYYNLAVYGGKR
jgi:tRNA (cmo5U34)-methyltransferase